MRKRKLSLVGSFVAAGVMAVFSCQPGVPLSGWDQKWGPAPSHQTFPGDCRMCHLEGKGGAPRQDFAFDHTREAQYRLAGAHAQAACLRCHNDKGPVAAYVARGCVGCHDDPHASALGTDCKSCHDQVSWKPRRSAARDVQIRFHRIPAHATPPCASCHVEAGVGRAQVGPAQCGPCHQ
jgi:hypothetical protein